MRALIVDAQGPRLLTDRPVPVPTPGHAQVRVLRAGLGCLDVAAVTGRIAHEGILGHEMVGRVIGSPSASMNGRVVAVSPEIACGACDLCRGGLAAHCRAIRLLGFNGTDGAIAEVVAVPMRNLALVPPGVGVQEAVLAQPVADAMHVARLVPVERKTYVTVVGDGLNALLVAQILARRNASVRLLGVRPERFGLGDRWQVRHRHLREAGLRADQDVVVLCSEPALSPDDLSGAEATRAAVGMLRPRGTLVVNGPAVDVPGVGLDLSACARLVVAGELRLLGARRGPIADGLEAIADDAVDLAPLLTRSASLDEGVGLLRAAARPEHLRTVIEIAA